MTDAFDTAFADMPLVAVLRHITTDEILPVADALMEAGFRFLEVPLNSPDAFTSIEMLTRHCPKGVMTGAGTVLEPEQCARLADTGAKLMVTPNTDAAVIDAAVSADLYPLIGCLTPTEALLAVRHGARGLKVFPASRMGPDYLKDIRAVLPKGTKVLPVGGIGLETMEAFHKTGADGFGYGANLYKPGKPAAEVGATARALVAEYRRLRGH